MAEFNYLITIFIFSRKLSVSVWKIVIENAGIVCGCMTFRFVTSGRNFPISRDLSTYPVKHGKHEWLGQWMWGYCRSAAAHRAFWTENTLSIFTPLSPRNCIKWNCPHWFSLITDHILILFEDFSVWSHKIIMQNRAICIQIKRTVLTILWKIGRVQI